MQILEFQFTQVGGIDCTIGTSTQKSEGEITPHPVSPTDTLAENSFYFFILRWQEALVWCNVNSMMLNYTSHLPSYQYIC